MRKWICVPMMTLCLLLGSCGGAGKEEMSLRQAYLDMSGCEMEADVTCGAGTEDALTFSLRCQYVPGKESGVEIRPCEKEAYDQACKEAFLDSSKAKYLNSLIAYQEYGKRVVPIKSVNGYTSQALLRQGFLWPITTPQYLKSFFDMISGLGFFDTFES